MKDAVNKETDILEYSSQEYRRKLTTVSKKLTFVDWLRFCRFINKSSTRHSEKFRKKKDQTFTALCKKKNGNLKLQHDNINNIAGVTLTQVKKDILCHDLKYRITENH